MSKWIRRCDVRCLRRLRAIFIPEVSKGWSPLKITCSNLPSFTKFHVERQTQLRPNRWSWRETWKKIDTVANTAMVTICKIIHERCASDSVVVCMFDCSEELYPFSACQRTSPVCHWYIDLSCSNSMQNYAEIHSLQYPQRWICRISSAESSCWNYFIRGIFRRDLQSNSQRRDVWMYAHICCRVVEHR